MAMTWENLWSRTKRLMLLGMVFLSLWPIAAPNLWARAGSGHGAHAGHSSHSGHSGGHGGGFHGGGSHLGGMHGRGGIHSGVTHGGRSHRGGIHTGRSHGGRTHIGGAHAWNFHGGAHRGAIYHESGIQGTGHVGGGHTYIAQNDHHSYHHNHHDHHDYHDYIDYFHYPHFDYHYYPSYFRYSPYLPFYSYGASYDYNSPGPLAYAPNRKKPATRELRGRLERPPTIESYPDLRTLPNNRERGEALDGVVIRRPLVEAVEAPEALPLKPMNTHRKELEENGSVGESQKDGEGKSKQ